VSFNFTGFFRQGAWRELRRFLLNQKRDALPRVRAINAELARIGQIRILYQRTGPDNPNSPMSERRIGIDVQPGTSLEKLLQAYIAQGGNPFDVSMFLVPDSYILVNDEGSTSVTSEVGTGDGERTSDTDPIRRETAPYSGIVYPISADPVVGGLYTGGWLPLWRYPPRKFGNNITYVTESAEMAPAIRQLRDWSNREIRNLRNNLEARIIKLCDLREQLLIERDEILPQAIGGATLGIPFDPDTFAVTHHTSGIIRQIDDVFYTLQDGYYDFENPRQSEPNPPYPVLLEDAPTGEEDWTSFG